MALQIQPDVYLHVHVAKGTVETQVMRHATAFVIVPEVKWWKQQILTTTDGLACSLYMILHGHGHLSNC